MDIGKIDVVNYVRTEGIVLSNEPPWYPTGLNVANYHMNDFQKNTWDTSL